LKAVGRSAGLVSTAAEEADAGGLELRAMARHCSSGFDSAGAGGHGEMFTTNEDVTGGSGDANDGRCRVFYVERDQFVGLVTGMQFDDAGRDSRTPRSMAPLLPVMPMAVRPRQDGMRFQAERFDFVADEADLFVRGVVLHDY